MALKEKLINNQQSIAYIAGSKREDMAFSRIIKIKLIFFKSMQNKITKKYQLYVFSFILEKKVLKEKRLKDYMIQQHFNSERKEKEGRKRRKKEKEKKEN